MKEKDKIVRVSDIDAALSYGETHSSVMWKSGVIVLGVGVWFCFLSSIAIAIIFPVTEGLDKDTYWIFIPVGATAFMCAMWGLIYWNYSKGTKYVKMRLDDAVILHASAKSLGWRWSYGKHALKLSSIKVTFKYNKKRIIKQGTYKNELGYSIAYNKYVREGEALIAYSPKYDEVMLIKPVSAERIEQELAEKSE